LDIEVVENATALFLEIKARRRHRDRFAIEAISALYWRNFCKPSLTESFEDFVWFDLEKPGNAKAIFY